MEAACLNLIEESIRFEYSIAELYSLYTALFPQDESFWQPLVMEEKNHAALLNNAKDIFCPKEELSRDLIVKSLQELQERHKILTSHIEQYKIESPSREEAFNTAFELENSAADLHFQNFIEKSATVITDNVFKKLNGDDQEHAERICAYMNANWIKIRGEEDL